MARPLAGIGARDGVSVWGECYRAPLVAQRGALINVLLTCDAVAVFPMLRVRAVSGPRW